MGLILSTKCGRLAIKKTSMEKLADEITPTADAADLISFFGGEAPITNTEVYIRFSEGVSVEVGCNEYDSGRCRLRGDSCLYGSLKIEMQNSQHQKM